MIEQAVSELTPPQLPFVRYGESLTVSRMAQLVRALMLRCPDEIMVRSRSTPEGAAVGASRIRRQLGRDFIVRVEGCDIYARMDPDCETAVKVNLAVEGLGGY